MTNPIIESARQRREATRVLGVEVCRHPYDEIAVTYLDGATHTEWRMDVDRFLATGIYDPSLGFDDAKAAKKAADRDRAAHMEVKKYRQTLAAQWRSGNLPTLEAETAAAAGRLEDAALAVAIRGRVELIGQIWKISDEQRAGIVALGDDGKLFNLPGESEQPGRDEIRQHRAAVAKICAAGEPLDRQDVEAAIGADSGFAAQLGATWQRLAKAHDVVAAEDWTRALSGTIEALGENLRPADGSPPAGPKPDARATN